MKKVLLAIIVSWGSWSCSMDRVLKQKLESMNLDRDSIEQVNPMRVILVSHREHDGVTSYCANFNDGSHIYAQRTKPTKGGLNDYQCYKVAHTCGAIKLHYSEKEEQLLAGCFYVLRALYHMQCGSTSH